MSWNTYLPTYLPTYQPTYLPTYLTTYLPTYISTYLPTYHTLPYPNLPHPTPSHPTFPTPPHLPACLPACLPASLPNWASRGSIARRATIPGISISIRRYTKKMVKCVSHQPISLQSLSNFYLQFRYVHRFIISL